MTKQQHPITLEQHPMTPPAELFKQWECMPRSLAFEAAYRAGADQELKACLELLDINGCPSSWIDILRTTRRPEPPSLAEEALDTLKTKKLLCFDHPEGYDIIRRALERLQELENNG